MEEHKFKQITRDELKAAVNECAGEAVLYYRDGGDIGKCRQAKEHAYGLIDQLFAELEQLRGRKPDYYQTPEGNQWLEIQELVDCPDYEIQVGTELSARPVYPSETYIVALKDGKKVAVLKEEGV